jgi:hypothetical protein
MPPSKFGPIERTSDHLRSKTGHFRAHFQQPVRVKAIESSGIMERAMGIEPTSEAWEARRKNLKATDPAALRSSSDWLSCRL